MDSAFSDASACQSCLVAIAISDPAAGSGATAVAAAAAAVQAEFSALGSAGRKMRRSCPRAPFRARRTPLRDVVCVWCRQWSILSAREASRHYCFSSPEFGWTPKFFSTDWGIAVQSCLGAPPSPTPYCPASSSSAVATNMQKHVSKVSTEHSGRPCPQESLLAQAHGRQRTGSFAVKTSIVALMAVIPPLPPPSLLMTLAGRRGTVACGSGTNFDSDS